MKVLKGYTKNQYRPEASIVERYVAKECIEFCLQYIDTVKSVGILESHYDKTGGGKGTRGYNVVTMTRQEVSQVHLYVLNNIADMIPYIEAHKQILRVSQQKMNMMRMLQEHNRTFFNRFRESIFVDQSASRTLRLLVVGPYLNVPT